jgi:threonylcarbamoyladenosine tRNA methylthiotransferase MtaB
MENNKKAFKIYTLGCKVNQYDSRYLGELLIKQGYERTKKGAEVVIINTCAVTRNAIAKDKRIISKAKKENPGAKVILMGCWPQAYEEEVRKIDDVDLIWGVGRIGDLITYIQGLLGYQPQADPEPIEYISQEDRSRYFLKIQDGCEHFCSYCIIPYTRGGITSRKQKHILQEAMGASHAGFKEIVVSGIHLGMYGKDTNTNIVELLNNVKSIPELGRVRLSSIEMNEVSDDLIDLIAGSRKICKHLHIPLQSGSDNILKAMNRPYVRDDFEKKIERIRGRIPDIAISTDVITGFPGEEEDDFKTTYDLVEKLRFSRLHVFPFSAHPGTPAANMDQQVAPEIAKQRSDKLIKLGEGLEEDFKRQFRGRELEVVVESVKGELMRGRTEYYFELDFSSSQITSYYDNEQIGLRGGIVKTVFGQKEEPHIIF